MSHKLSHTSEYRAWQTMRLRCANPENPAFPDYGGRGITVCPEWADSVEQFVADMGPKPTPAHELDRRDNDKGYCPDNCRWVIRRDNCRNRRSNRIVVYRGARMTIAEASELSGVTPTTAWHRLDAGWSEEDAFTVPTRLKATKGEGKKKTPMTNKHGLKGVKYDRKSDRFYGRRMVEGKRLQTKKFRTPEEAHAAYLLLGANTDKNESNS